jgi:L-asparaginase
MLVMPILILVTGGTFDKEYNELTGELFFKETHLPEMLRLGRNLVKTKIIALDMIDSLYMTDAYRVALAGECNQAVEERILITHGTDTMVETAVYLEKAVRDKTIVLTGAMIPYKFGSSDGLFNLGSAMAFVQTLPTGVYIAMNGSFFPAGHVRKNKSRGLFEKTGE